MKNISFILFVLFALTVGSSITSCGPETNPTPTPVDTTEPEDTTPVVVLTNQVKVGFELYKLNTSEAQTFGEYSNVSLETTINVSGSDATFGLCDFTIRIPEKTAGTYTTLSGNDTYFSLGTGLLGDVRREEFSATNDNVLITIDVTEFGAVGESIKGTFTGKVINARTGGSVNVTEGKFDVIRRSDK